tara:strand:- start:794 stop:1939 length:1146 start_codon:yes stop_codon:yes gene_type:complete
MNMINNVTKALQRQWSSRSSDQRFLNLDDMLNFSQYQKRTSESIIKSSANINFVSPGPDSNELGISVNGEFYEPTHWSFGQICRLVRAPAHYFREQQAALTQKCLENDWVKRNKVLGVKNFNFFIQKTDNPNEPIGDKAYREPHRYLRAITSENYQRIDNAEVIKRLIDNVGNGRDGKYRCPHVRGAPEQNCLDTTTLFASDRDMWVFLCDETKFIRVENRRDGADRLSRGFMLWNSEVGSASLGMATFLYDHVCNNRLVMGVKDVTEKRIYHTASGPEKYITEMMPLLENYANASMKEEESLIKNAQATKVTNVEKLFSKEFGKKEVKKFTDIHMEEENRPIETYWDVATAITAHARSIPHQNERIRVERKAGKILQMAA